MYVCIYYYLYIPLDTDTFIDYDTICKELQYTVKGEIRIRQLRNTSINILTKKLIIDDSGMAIIASNTVILITNL